MADDAWRPEVEAVALALAVADYGPQQTSLMGPSAARVHGALPRAVATAVVAVPRQRPALATAYGHLVFVERHVENLEVEPTRTALVTGFVTTVEQTMLDLAHRPALGGLTAEQASEAVRTLALRADWEETLQLARRQRLHAAYRRARWVADTVLDKATPDWPSRRPVPGLGLRPPTPGDDGFGIAPNRPDDAPS